MGKKIKQSYGNRLKECIASSNMTQKELALRTGYTPQYISNIICNKRCMSLESARLFSKVLGFREEYLLGIDNYKTNTDLFFNSSCSSTISFFDSAAYNYLSSIGHNLSLHWNSSANSDDIYNYLTEYNIDRPHCSSDKDLFLSEDSNASVLKINDRSFSMSDTIIEIDGVELSPIDFFDLLDDLKDYADFLISNVSKRKERRSRSLPASTAKDNGNI